MPRPRFVYRVRVGYIDTDAALARHNEQPSVGDDDVPLEDVRRLIARNRKADAKAVVNPL